jgi:hypothetical protein
MGKTLIVNRNTQQPDESGRANRSPAKFSLLKGLIQKKSKTDNRKSNADIRQNYGCFHTDCRVGHHVHSIRNCAYSSISKILSISRFVRDQTGWNEQKKYIPAMKANWPQFVLRFIHSCILPKKVFLREMQPD